MIKFFQAVKLFIFYLYMIWNGHSYKQENFKQVWKICKKIVGDNNDKCNS